MIELTLYPAHNGDSMMLQLEGRNILIDGGYVNTFNDFILKDLEKKAQAGESISHVIVTHIDQDHISGIVKLFEKNNQDQLIQIENVWHNSYRHIHPKATKVIQEQNERLAEIKGKSYLKEVAEEEKEVSAKQGSSLASYLLEGDYSWNSEFEGKSISTDNCKEVNLDDDTKFILLSPNDNKLSNLERKWRKELKKHGFLDDLNDEEYYDDAFEFMVSRIKEAKRVKETEVSGSNPDISELTKIDFIEDNTAPNGSSIAFIVEYKDKRLLFLGDSHPSLIIKSLVDYYGEEQFPMNFDLIKVSHHGSFSNNSPELLTKVDSNRFVFSTNGKGHNHPDPETIAHIINRETKIERQLFINYPSTKLADFNTKELKEDLNFKITEGDGLTPINIEIKDE